MGDSAVKDMTVLISGSPKDGRLRERRRIKLIGALSHDEFSWTIHVGKIFAC